MNNFWWQLFGKQFQCVENICRNVIGRIENEKSIEQSNEMKRETTNERRKNKKNKRRQLECRLRD